MPGQTEIFEQSRRVRGGSAHRTRRMIGAFGCLVLTLTMSCASDSEPTQSAGSDSSPPSSAGAPLASGVQLVDTTAAVNEPIAMAAAPGGKVMLIAERAGTVGAFAIKGDQLKKREVLLDLSEQVGETSGERGLLGIAVGPDGKHVYLSYTRASDGASVVDEFTLGGTPDAPTAQRSSRRQLLVVKQPYANHNGGHIEFGPDNMLYLGLGDGGSADDPDGNGQNPAVPLGKVLRLDPTRPNSVPADNPDLEGWDPRIWLRGVRNPWRFSFDSANGDLWIGDVGQNEIEEIDALRAADGGGKGANLGWDLREGNAEFGDADPAAIPAGPLTEPIHTYTHDDGCSVTGGVVYRGSALPDLVGKYLFTDFCQSGLLSLAAGGGTSTRDSSPLKNTSDVNSVVSFGVGPDKEIYVISLESGVFHLQPA